MARTSGAALVIDRQGDASTYQAIIGMGETALPFILDEMRQRDGHWFWALRAITGENPVPPEHRGNVEAMTQDWLQWARQRGCL